MAHMESGIRASPELIDALTNAGSDIRCIRSTINNNALVVSSTILKNSSYLDDFNLVYNSSEDNEPAYYFYRLALDSEWLLIQYIPDTAIIRLKMLYASSKTALLKDMVIKFQDQFFATHKSELTQQGYLKHRKHCESENPLTNREIEIQRIRVEESVLSTQTAKKSLMTSLSFTPSQGCIDSLVEFKDKSVNFVSIIVGLDETFELEVKKCVESTNFSNATTDTDPKFILYAHDEMNVFCYICPPKAPIKRKMMFSSSKSGLIGFIEESGIHLDHKFEVDDFKEFEGELKGLKTAASPIAKFNKPMRPGRI